MLNMEWNISIASEWDQAEGVALARDFDMKASMSHGPAGRS